MSLGYALLHRNRIEIALSSGPTKRKYEETADMIMGALGISDIGEGVNDYIQRQFDKLQSLIEPLMSLGDEGGPLSFLHNFEGGLGISVEDISGKLNDILSFIRGTNSGLVRERAMAWIDRLLDALPEMSGEALAQFVREQINDLSTLFEGRFRDGARDQGAHCSFRAAAVIRHLFGQAAESAVEGELDFDFKATIRQTIEAMLAKFDEGALGQITAQLQTLIEKFGGIANAILQLSTGASLSFDVNVEGENGNENEGPPWFHEAKAVPHDWPEEGKKTLWSFDFVTGFFTTFSVIWEVVRMKNIKDREADFGFHVYLILWQFTRWIVRSVLARDSVNLNISEYGDVTGDTFVNWLFSDGGDLSMHMLWRFLGTTYDMGDGAVSNWALSFAPRMLQYFTHVVNWRWPYWFGRSMWYFHQKKQADQFYADSSVVRMLWSVWGPMMFVTWVFVFFPSVANFLWDIYGLEPALGGDDAGKFWGLFVPAVVVGGVGGYLLLALVSGGNPFRLKFGPDWPTLIIATVLLIFGAIAVAFIIADLETDLDWAAWLGYAIFMLLILVSIVGFYASWGSMEAHSGPGEHRTEHDIRSSQWFTHWLTIIGGILFGGLIQFFMWWFYMDDGRDKNHDFEPLEDAGEPPYKLPYRKDENWFCGQANQGMFSHFISGGSAYAYDFNEEENRPALATRGGIVVRVREIVSNGTDGTDLSGGDVWSNQIEVQHTDWVAGHDPGTDNERVLTKSIYHHFSQNRIWVLEGHRIVQGYYVADIDSTGESAQHHVHLEVVNDQNGDEISIPFLLADESLKSFRMYPFIYLGEGKKHIDGKPLAMAYYVSDNEEQDAVVNPMVVVTSTESGHFHELHIDHVTLETITLPLSSKVLYTTVADNHYHRITLSSEQIASVLGLKDLAGMTVDEEQGHTHSLVSHPHGRDVSSGDTRDIRVVQPPCGYLLAGNPAFGDVGSGNPLFYRFAGEQFVVRVNGRSTEYYFGGVKRGVLRADVAIDRGMRNSNRVWIDGIGHTVATISGNPERHGAHSLANALSVALRSAQSVMVRAEPVVVIETRRRGNEAQLSLSGSALGTLQAPQTSATGSGAFGNLQSISRSAVETHFRTVLSQGWPTASFVVDAHIVTSGDPNFAGQSIDQPILTIGGPEADFAASQSRNASVLEALKSFDAGAGPETSLRAWGPMPLCGGRIAIGQVGGAADDVLNVPVLATPAGITIDTTHAAFGSLDASRPLRITVQNEEYRIALLEASQIAPDALSRTIMEQVEGVRAWPDGNNVVVETVGAGVDESIGVEKNGASAADNLVIASVGGSRADLTIPGATPGTTVAVDGVADTTAITPLEFVNAVQDAQLRGTLPYDPSPAGINVHVELNGENRLVVQVNDPHTINVREAVYAAGEDPFNFQRPLDGDGNEIATRVESGVLPTSVTLAGTGWVDFEVNGDVVRVPLDGEPARSDIHPGEHLPRSGEVLNVSVNGGADTVVSFTSDISNTSELFSAIAQALGDCTVRLAYALSIEDALYRDSFPGGTTLDIPVANFGRAALGFFREVAEDVRIGWSDDLLALPSNLHTRKYIDYGERVDRIVDPVSGDQSGLITGGWNPDDAGNPDGPGEVTLSVASGYEMRCTSTPADDDPFGFANGWQVALGSTHFGTPFDLGVHCREYHIEVQETLNNWLIAHTRFQLTAAPAILRTSNAAAFSFEGTLTITVIEPDGAGSAERSYGVVLDGLAAIDDVAERIDNQVPSVHCWVAQVGTDLRLHIETIGGGTAWGIRLDNPILCLALGFTQEDIDLPNQRIEAYGKGNIRNYREVQGSEVAAVFENALRCLTGWMQQGTLAPFIVQITTDAAIDPNVLRLVSHEGTVTMESEPPELRDMLDITEQEDVTTVSAPGAITNASLCEGTLVVKAGGRTCGAVHLWANPASLEADTPLPDDAVAGGGTEADMLAFIVGRNMVIDASGHTETVNVPAATSTLNEALLYIAAHMPSEGFLSIDANNTIVLQSRASGTNQNISIDFNAFSAIPEADFPDEGLLGFDYATLTGAGWVVSATGSGNVPDIESVQVAGAGAGTLQTLLTDALGEGGTLQAVYTSEVQPGPPQMLSIRANLQGATVEQPSAGPGNVHLFPPGTTAVGAAESLETAYNTDREIAESGIISFNVVEPTTTVTREAKSLLGGNPAKVEGIVFPDDNNDLNWETLTITIGTIAETVTFHADGTTTNRDIAAQIERGTEWNVKAAVNGNQLTLITVDRGSGLTINVSGSAVTNSPSGFTVTGAAVINGTGSVSSMQKVSADDYKAVIQAGYIEDSDAMDITHRDTRDFRQVYRADASTQRRHFLLRSQRNGCISAVELIVDNAPSLAFDRSFERGPAMHGSVVLPPFTNTKRLNGTLQIEFNRNGGIAGFPLTSVVSVEFPDRDYTAYDVANRIYEELFDSGAGWAAAFPDGTVVIETSAPGLGGTVCVPAPGGGSTDSVVTALLPGGVSELFDRGWPGIGMESVSSNHTGRIHWGIRAGRSDVPNAATWNFTCERVPPAGGATAPVTAVVAVTSGATPAGIATLANAALRAPSDGGVALGRCLVGEGDILMAEFSQNECTFQLGTPAVDFTAEPPPRRGGTPERHDEPALLLRRTSETRTFRFFRDPTGRGILHANDDTGWVRFAANAENGDSLSDITFANGRYWIAVRPDATKTNEYSADDEMIASAGTHPDDENLHFVHKARYWVYFHGGQPRKIVRAPNGDYLVETIWGT